MRGFLAPARAFFRGAMLPRTLPLPSQAEHVLLPWHLLHSTSFMAALNCCLSLVMPQLSHFNQLEYATKALGFLEVRLDHFRCSQLLRFILPATSGFSLRSTE